MRNKRTVIFGVLLILLCEAVVSGKDGKRRERYDITTAKWNMEVGGDASMRMLPDGISYPASYFKTGGIRYMVMADFFARAYRVLNSNVSVGASFDFAADHKLYISAIYPDGCHLRLRFYDLLPRMRVVWFRESSVELGSEMAAGIRMIRHTDTAGDGVRETLFRGAWELIPFSISAGRRVYFRLDVLMGTEDMGLRPAVGVRF